MLRASLCVYSDAYILVKVTLTITRIGANAAARQEDEKDKGVISKNLHHLLNAQAKFLDSREIDVVMLSII